jgi:DNA-binding response OmpR family regulator
VQLRQHAPFSKTSATDPPGVIFIVYCTTNSTEQLTVSGSNAKIPVVHILLATDAQWVLDEVLAALGSPDTSFTVCRNGRDVPEAIATRTPDLAVLDLQIGSMGAMAVTMNLRLDHSDHRIPHVPVLMLLDRKADVHLARRSGANGWIIKPLDALRLQRAANAVASGESWHDGEVLAANA